MAAALWWIQGLTVKPVGLSVKNTTVALDQSWFSDGLAAWLNSLLQSAAAQVPHATLHHTVPSEAQVEAGASAVLVVVQRSFEGTSGTWSGLVEEG